MSLERALDDLRSAILTLNDPESSPEYIERFDFVDVGGKLHMEFQGSSWGDAYSLFMAGIASEPIASAMFSVRIGGPDEGANGTRNWDLTPLANAATAFPNLRSLHIEQGRPADHNRTIVAAAYEEGGILAEIARKAANLVKLTTPSAPSAEFFAIDLPSLEYLNVDAGYDTQSFILNLSRSNRLSSLRCLEWGEYCETYMTDWRERCVPLDDYRALFGSQAFRQIRRFVFKNPACSAAELAELKSLRPDLQVLLVRWSNEYL
jgi:hypothetical protein